MIQEKKRNNSTQYYLRPALVYANDFARRRSSAVVRRESSAYFGLKNFSKKELVDALELARTSDARWACFNDVAADDEEADEETTIEVLKRLESLTS